MIAIVLGHPDHVEADLMRFRLLDHDQEETWIAVNQAGPMFWGQFDHWASVHPENLKKWALEPRGIKYMTWSWRGDVDWVLDLWSGKGHDSGLLAVKVAMFLGCEKIVLCGVPLDGWKEKERTWYQDTWRSVFGLMEGRVKSMSGWTRDLLGEPTEEWLND